MWGREEKEIQVVRQQHQTRRDRTPREGLASVQSATADRERRQGERGGRAVWQRRGGHAMSFSAHGAPALRPRLVRRQHQTRQDSPPQGGSGERLGRRGREREWGR